MTKKPRADVRWQIRTTAEQQHRAELLMQKKAIDLAAVVNNAVKEMFDREIGEVPKRGKKKSA